MQKRTVWKLLIKNLFHFQAKIHRKDLGTGNLFYAEALKKCFKTISVKRFVQKTLINRNVIDKLFLKKLGFSEEQDFKRLAGLLISQ